MKRESFLEERLVLFRNYFPSPTKEQLFDRLFDETRWLQPGYLNEDGRTVYLPRLTANYGERSYDYSGLTFTPEPWTPLLQELKEVAEREAQTRFNALILQLYRDGADTLSWHSDSSPLVGQNPVIASLSLGGARCFEVKHALRQEERLALNLEGGDLLIMQGDLQHQYLHRVRKEAQATPRINLTFRTIIDAVIDAADSKANTVFREVKPARS